MCCPHHSSLFFFRRAQSEIRRAVERFNLQDPIRLQEAPRIARQPVRVILGAVSRLQGTSRAIERDGRTGRGWPHV